MSTLHFWFTTDARLSMEDVVTLLGSLCLTDVDSEAMTCKTLEKPDVVASVCHTIFGGVIPVIVSYDDEFLYEYAEQPPCPDCGVVGTEPHDRTCGLPASGYDASDEV